MLLCSSSTVLGIYGCNRYKLCMCTYNFKYVRIYHVPMSWLHLNTDKIFERAYVETFLRFFGKCKRLNMYSVELTYNLSVFFVFLVIVRLSLDVTNHKPGPIFSVFNTSCIISFVSLGFIKLPHQQCRLETSKIPNISIRFDIFLFLFSLSFDYVRYISITNALLFHIVRMYL